jgi:hypothetical protein
MSVAEVANTTITLLRGTTTDEWGDTIDAGTPVASAIPAFLAETSHRVQDPTTPMPRVIRQTTARVPYWLGVQNTDQVVDETSGDKYIVLAVTQPPSLFGNPSNWPLVLDLGRVTGAGT